MWGRQGLFDAEDEHQAGRSYEQIVFVNLHKLCDKLKPEDRLDLVRALSEKFNDNDMPEGLSRFIEIETFKRKVREVISPFEKKIPKKTKRVVVSDDEGLFK
ncbi:hypothetical protein HK104_001153 [Borealophlyctis nickersoniae]|nr:hypothetical protein HK104_001153 [Borealophlyctis nickersoniae]